MEEEYQKQEFHIPINFKDPGFFFNGMVSLRNLVDAVILGFVGFQVAHLFPFNDEWALSGYILFIGLFGMFGIIGIQGLPLSVFLLDYLKWRKRKRPFLFNHHGESYKISAADAMLNETPMRDVLADMVDKVRDSISHKEIEYIEGETFEFAEDPELESLRFAEELLAEKEKAEKESQESEEETKLVGTATTNEVPAEQVDFNHILENIEISEMEEGGKDA